ncbi:hypothetical protein AB4Y95_00345 [Arthrobacter sp. M-10]|uniref:hypothetical protein n=1 Tax=Arthrobacter sp. M-10 TaxID=3233037 RepID=UPI003F906ED4
MITTDQIAEILELNKADLTAANIKVQLSLDIGIRQIQRIIAKHTSRADKLFMGHDGSKFWEQVLYQELGLAPNRCVACNEDKKFISLEGATWNGTDLRQLMPTCLSCLDMEVDD